MAYKKTETVFDIRVKQAITKEALAELREQMGADIARIKSDVNPADKEPVDKTVTAIQLDEKALINAEKSEQAMLHTKLVSKGGAHPDKIPDFHMLNASGAYDKAVAATKLLLLVEAQPKVNDEIDAKYSGIEKAMIGSQSDIEIHLLHKDANEDLARPDPTPQALRPGTPMKRA